jgi:hypothetical protein
MGTYGGITVIRSLLELICAVIPKVEFGPTICFWPFWGEGVMCGCNKCSHAARAKPKPRPKPPRIGPSPKVGGRRKGKGGRRK